MSLAFRLSGQSFDMSKGGSEARPWTKCAPGNDGLTKQSFKDESDINWIVARFIKTGFLNVDESKRAIYGDFTSVPAYMDALNMVASAKEAFDALPSSIRERFVNNPVKMVEFCSDPSNYEEGLKLGLFKEKKEAVGGKESGPKASESAPKPV